VTFRERIEKTVGILNSCTRNEFPSKVDLDAGGGFAWWYCDLIDANGDGVVLIWFFGLPFLPGYEGRRERPAAHPGLNLAVYRGGEPSFYLLEEQPQASYALEGSAWRWRFGDSTLTMRFEGDEVLLDGELSLTVPGAAAPTLATLSVRGLASRVRPTQGDSRHVWCPIAPSAEGRVEVLTSDGERWSQEGRAYLDANTSLVPLSDLDLAAWRWGRLAFPDREVVFYEVTRAEDGSVEPLVLDIPRGGEERRAGRALEWGRARRSVYGLSCPDGATLVDPLGRRIGVRVRHLVEDGPFYLRFTLEATCLETGERAQGFGEHVEVSRLDVPWQRPFVRMRRRLASGDNSMWLPLFSGPRRGRVGRLVRHWLGRSEAAT